MNKEIILGFLFSYIILTGVTSVIISFYPLGKDKDLSNKQIWFLAIFWPITILFLILTLISEYMKYFYMNFMQSINNLIK